MAVYVDKPTHTLGRKPARKLGRMIMCHMLADTLEELHQMAEKIGLKRSWFQGNASTPHYDICKSKRALALQHGAIEIDRRQTAQLIRRLRIQRQTAPI